MSGLHAGSERPPGSPNARETQEEEDQRHLEGDARAALDDASHPHGRATDADANLRSTSTIRAWGAIFGKRGGGRSSATGLLLLGLALAVTAILVALS